VTANATSAAMDAQLELNAGEIGLIKGHAALTRTTGRWQDIARWRSARSNGGVGFATLYARRSTAPRAAGGRNLSTLAALPACR